jgi:glycosyltransferase involved in cell wall biosynthesis
VSAVPTLSVVIPTRDRCQALAETLDALDLQEAEAASIEVIVVDNGSSDGTLSMLEARVGRLPVQVLTERRPGPAAARNRGVEAARAPVVVLLGDDMAPAEPGTLDAHRRLHAARPDRHYAVLGRATWRPDRPVTPFMLWLEAGGPQFAFGQLAPGPVDPARYLYTAHLSLKRQVLLAEPFDERFPFAAVEDSELGIRLDRLGLTLDYHPELVVHHDHPTDVWAFARRMYRVGASARLLHTAWPDDRSNGLPRPSPWWPAYPAAGRAVAGALRAGCQRPRLWSLFLWSQYASGYRNADREIPALTT